MATRVSVERTIRPQVIVAAYRLQTFTVDDLVDTTDLSARQVYAQLNKLEEEELVVKSRLPADQPFRPKNLYEVPSEILPRLAKEIAKYGLRLGEDTVPSGLAITREGTLAKVVSRGDALLNEIEDRLSSIVPATLTRDAIDQVMATFGQLAKSLGEVEIDVETAEGASRSSPEDHRGVHLGLRLRETRGILRDLEKAVRKQRNVLWLQDLVEHWVPNIQNHVHWAREVLSQKEGKFDTELVLDLLSPGLHRNELIPAVLASHAIRTNNLDLIRACLKTLNHDDSPWWRYNEVNADFLEGHYEEVYKRWDSIYANLKRDVSSVDKGTAVGVYLYNPRDLKESKLLPLLQKYNVSIVSPYALAAWNLSEEVVRPLLVDPFSVARSDYGPLISTIALCPEKGSSAVWELFAYGPLTAMIRRWPGAPALRVAAGLDGLTSVDVDVPKIAEALRLEKGVVVLEGTNVRDLGAFQKDAETALGDVEIITSAEARALSYAIL